MTQHYTVTITGYPATVVKAVDHVSSSLHWSKMFYTLNREGENIINAYGKWTSLESDVKNFKVYYPKLTFEVKIKNSVTDENPQVLTF